MARITVEDCLAKIPNRFELVVVAAKRARILAYAGDEPFVPWENDKCTVVALREIAKGHVTLASLDQEEKNIQDTDVEISSESAQA